MTTRAQHAADEHGSISIHLKKLHAAQKLIMAEAKRFNVLKCGRRFGKTELTKELAINPMLDGDPVGYWCPTYKDLADVWDEVNHTLFPIISDKSEQLKQITLITGGKIDFWSMEDPNSGRGRKYKRAILDECEKARHFKQAWNETIRATLVDLKGDAWFMSTPKFGRTYFKELAKFKAKYPNWNSWTFTSYDNPYLDRAEIDEAKAQLDDLTFRCEYLAEDVDVVGRPFAYCFDKARHIGPCSYDPEAELMLSFDFNVDPITAVAAQNIEGQLRFIKEFRLPNSNIYDLCDVINAEYAHSNPLFLITGDATGKARSAITKGKMNYYYVIKEKLHLNSAQMKVRSVNPAVSDSRVLMNSLMQNYDVIADPDNCPYLIEDWKYVEVDDEGDIIKDRSSETKKADLLDCSRYLMSTFFQWFLKSNKNTIPSEPNMEDGPPHDNGISYDENDEFGY